ncbi:PilZ domain-containing protein [Neptuniibacter sp. 1_MG-2023]|uniref:PilZ domain-containing protein n=1 Tax=Neptuniibacter sp. 1_MG-2023 TaxID=3062662 RepID=UPI0026E19857|nr:PilZ domain-containing protein [Neptuniibacter sp. 1_MG-2023]MDO6594894.1 PilZ domain-containing protein [Neptuniibacter sp. 1_MG-2023]
MDRRTYPRIDTDLPAEVQMFAGSSIDVRLINLSLGGMLVEGGKEVELLRPLVDGAPLELSLHFGLNQYPLHCHCRVVYQRRQSQGCIQLGLSLLSIDDRALALLQQYISEQLT